MVDSEDKTINKKIKVRKPRKSKFKLEYEEVSPESPMVEFHLLDLWIIAEGNYSAYDEMVRTIKKHAIKKLKKKYYTKKQEVKGRGNRMATGINPS